MSRINESCLIWMSHVSYEWVMSYINESCLIWMSHVSYEWVMAHMNESCLVWMGHVSYEWVMSHMNESCLILMSHVSYEWVMSHMNESSPISYECVTNGRFAEIDLQDIAYISHGMSHVNESCHTWRSHVTHMYEYASCHVCIMSCIKEPYNQWLIAERDLKDKVSHLTWLIYAWHDLFIYDKTQAYYIFSVYCAQSYASNAKKKKKRVCCWRRKPVPRSLWEHTTCRFFFNKK